jgi:ribonuclease HI
MSYDYIVGTDGACRNNQAAGGQPGTWAVAVMSVDGEIKGYLAGNNKSTTNNEMEATAIVNALRWSVKHKKKILLLTDSQYLYNTLTTWAKSWKAKGWKKSDGQVPANLELIKEAYELLDPILHTLQWVKGHQKNPSSIEGRANIAADARCNEEYLNKFI